MALIVFDLDDTLYTSEGYTKARERSLMELLGSKHGVDAVGAAKLFAQKKAQLKKEGLPPSATLAFTLLGVSREEFLIALDAPPAEKLITFSERTKDAIAALADEHELVVYSNSPASSVERILRILRIREHFADVYHADRFPQSKPYKPAIEFILATHKQRPVISVGDSLEKDLIPFKEFGAKLVWVQLSEVAHPKVDAVVRDIGDLPHLGLVNDFSAPPAGKGMRSKGA